MDNGKRIIENIFRFPIFWLIIQEEFSQIFVRGRTFDAGDLIVDFEGIFIFGQIARFIIGRFNHS